MIRSLPFALLFAAALFGSRPLPAQESELPYLPTRQDASGKVGFFDQQGNCVIPCLFDKAISFRKGGSATSVTHDGHNYLIARSGQLITELKRQQFAFECGRFCWIQNEPSHRNDSLIDLRGRRISPAGYHVEPIHYNDPLHFLMRRAGSDGLYRLTDLAGKPLGTVQARAFTRLDHNRGLIECVTDSGHGLLNAEGEVLIPARYTRFVYTPVRDLKPLRERLIQTKCYDKEIGEAVIVFAYSGRQVTLFDEAGNLLAPPQQAKTEPKSVVSAFKKHLLPYFLQWSDRKRQIDERTKSPYLRIQRAQALLLQQLPDPSPAAPSLVARLQREAEAREREVAEAKKREAAAARQRTAAAIRQRTAATSRSTATASRNTAATSRSTATASRNTATASRSTATTSRSTAATSRSTATAAASGSRSAAQNSRSAASAGRTATQPARTGGKRLAEPPAQAKLYFKQSGNSAYCTVTVQQVGGGKYGPLVSVVRPWPFVGASTSGALVLWKVTDTSFIYKEFAIKDRTFEYIRSNGSIPAMERTILPEGATLELARDLSWVRINMKGHQPCYDIRIDEAEYRRLDQAWNTFRQNAERYGGGGASGGSVEVETGRSASYYQEMYNRWARVAESAYRSLTATGVSVRSSSGERAGSTLGTWQGSNLSGMKSELHKAQAAMRRVREEAARAGHTIAPSSWESATVTY